MFQERHCTCIPILLKAEKHPGWFHVEKTLPLSTRSFSALEIFPIFKMEDG